MIVLIQCQRILKRLIHLQVFCRRHTLSTVIGSPLHFWLRKPRRISCELKANVRAPMKLHVVPSRSATLAVNSARGPLPNRRMKPYTPGFHQAHCSVLSWLKSVGSMYLGRISQLPSLVSALWLSTSSLIARRVLQ